MQITLETFAEPCKYILMKKKDSAERCSFFKALSDPNRLSIFDFLCRCARKGPSSANVKEVAGCCDVDLSVVSRHLSTLKDSGLLDSEKRGKEVFYKVNGKEIARLLRAMADEIEGDAVPAASPSNKPGENNE